MRDLVVDIVFALVCVFWGYLCGLVDATNRQRKAKHGRGKIVFPASLRRKVLDAPPNTDIFATDEEFSALTNVIPVDEVPS